MRNKFLALLFALIAAPALAQPATPCTPKSGSWVIASNVATLWVCSDDGLSWFKPTVAWTSLTGVPAAVTNLSGTNTGDQTITLTGDVTGTGTGSFATAIKSSVSLTTPVIGVATGTSLAVTGLLTSSGTAGIGYASGAGGTVTQATNKTTGVAINKVTGDITMNGAALAAAAIVSFTVTNSTVAATDNAIVNHVTTGTFGAYQVSVNTFAAGSFKITVKNISAGSLSEAIVIRFTILKGATS